MTLIDISGKKLVTEKKLHQAQFTNAHLFQFMKDYFEVRGTLIGMLNRSKLNEFYKANFLRYETLLKEMNELEEKFFVMEEDATTDRGLKRKIKITEVDGKEKKEYVFQQGYAVNDYNVAIRELMALETVIYW
jgi:predicted translin family RNA/ssDNA-binding protein